MTTRHHQPGFMTGIALLLPITLTTMAIILLAPIIPDLMAEFASVPHHEYWVPMILTVPSLCSAILCPVAGILGDYFGRRRLLLVSVVLYAMVGIAPVFLSDLTAILVSRVGVGIAEALIYVLTTTLIGDYYDGATRDKWLAAQTAFASVSALIFFNLGGILGEGGWRTPFWAYSTALIMLVLVVVYTWEPSNDVHPDDAAEHAPHNTSWASFPWLKMAMIVAITIYGSVFFYTVQIQAPSGLSELGLTSPAERGFLTSIASIGVPLGSAAAVPTFLVGCFINQLGAGMLLPTLVVWAMSILSFEIRGRGTGIWQAAFALGQFLSPVVVTFAGDRAGGLLGAFSVLAVAALGGAVVALITGRVGTTPPNTKGLAAHG